MNAVSKLFRHIAFMLVGLMAVSMMGCSDDVDESNLYTFTGNTITGFLAKSDSFKLYSKCLARTPLSKKSKSTFADLLSARGNYTVFAPTDEAVQHLIDSIYNKTGCTIEEVHDTIVEKIVRCGIIDNQNNDAYRVEDFVEGSIPTTNADDRYLTVKFDTLAGRAITKINNDATIIADNIELVNGFVHAVDRVVMLSNAYVSSVVDEAPNLRIFSYLLKKTGWADKLTQYRDEEYEEKEHPDNPKTYEWGKDRVPQHRYFGYTIFVETDSVFHEKWGIDIPANKEFTPEEAERVLSQISAKCREAYPSATSATLTSPDNAINQFVSYHLLEIRVPYNWLVVHRTEKGFSYKNPSRLSINCDNYWETLSDRHRRLLKITEGPTTDGLRINRYYRYDRDSYDEIDAPIKGIGIRSTNGDYDNNALNGFYYPIDDILVYNDDVPGKVLNQRIRMDLSTYYPELINNGMFITDYNGHTIPHGYLKHVTMNAPETEYHYLTGFNAGWNDMYCDEHNVTGSYDFTLRLPPVPFSGSWEIRLVYSYSVNRGMAQLYFGTNKQNLQAYGLPIDQRVQVTNPTIGYKLDPEEDPVVNRERDKDMRNKGYMMGCKHEGPSTGGIVTTTLYDVNGQHRLRKIFYTGNLEPDETYYIRFKSVLANTATMFVLDYVEFAPKAVYNGEIPEDYW